MKNMPPAATLAVIFAISTGAALAVAPPWKAKDLNPVTIKKPVAHPPIQLAAPGVTNGAIVVADQRARGANDLQQYIQEATGVKLAIVNRAPGTPLPAPAIVLGDCPEALALSLDSRNMPPEGFAIKTTTNLVFIVGNVAGPEGNGIQWGVYEFLERFVGMRWFFPQAVVGGPEIGMDIPRRDRLEVPPTWIEDAPVFRKREIFPPCSDPWHGSGIMLSRIQLFLRSGSSWPTRLQVHQPNWGRDQSLVSASPEVFQLKKDGSRQYDVICYGNSKTLEIYLKGIQNHLDGKPPYYAPISGKAITVSPADVEIACYCKDCRKLWNENGGQYGLASRVMADFVDKLAREVSRRWPTNGFTVIFLPYLNYTMAPEGYKFPGNVEVQICGMPGMANYKEPAVMAEEQDNVDKWIAISGRKIQNWHYNVWPAHKTKAAYHYPHVIQNYYRQNRDKTIGSFINGDYNHWPRQHISMYCWLKLLWNPEYDVDAAIDEFTRRMFGKAAPAMRELLEIQMESWEKSRWPDGMFSPRAIYTISYPPQIIERMKKLIAKAFDAGAGDDLVSARLAYYAHPTMDDFFKEAETLSGKGFKPLAAQKVGENPIIDGKLDDPQWQRAQPNTFVAAGGPKQGQPSHYATEIKAVWTTEGITFAFKMTEPTPARLCVDNGGHDNGTIWWDDNVELLLDPSGKQLGLYYHFIINADGNYWDSRLKDTTFECSNFKTKAFRGPDYWSLEVFLPYASFPEAVKPGSGTHTKWAGNFTRHRVADNGLNPPNDRLPDPDNVREYQRMNTTGASSSDNLADFSTIEFIE